MFFVFVGWPWSNQQSKLIRARFQQRDEVSLLAPGQFRESAASHRVFFIEKMSPDQGHVENVFVTSTENGKVNVVVSKNGHTETHKNGDRFVVLENGRRYDGEPGQPELPHHGVRALRREDPEPAGRQYADHHRHAHARRCCAIRPSDNLAEFAWRAGLPLIAINLMLLAIPLAHQNPRRSRTINLVMAVLIYLTYSNLLNVVQSWIEQGKMSFGVGLVSLHVIVAAIVAFIFWLRVRNRPLFTRAMFSRSQGA